MRVTRDLIRQYDGEKKCYQRLIQTLNEISLEYDFMIYHCFGSYYARKYINKYAGSLGDYSSPSIDLIKNEFGSIFSYINEDYILDLNKCYLYIKKYIDYYNTVTFHEWVPEVDYGIKHALTESEYTVYRNMGLNLIISTKEFQLMMRSGSLYTKLMKDIALGVKYPKDKTKDKKSPIYMER